MDAFFANASAKMGGTPTAEQLKIMASILSSYPCAMLFKLIPNSQVQLKHLFSIFITSYIMISVLHYYDGFMHITASCLFTYFFMKYYKRKNGAWINFFVIMLSMSTCHLKRQFRGFDADDSNDSSGAMMIATIKLTSYGFNVLDGRTQDQSQLYGYNKRMKVNRYPTLVEFFGWMFFFGGFLVGPTSEFMDYMRFVTMDMFRTKEGKMQVPSTIKQTLILVVKSLFFVAFIMLLSPYCNSASIDTDSWRSLSLVKKLVYVQCAAFISRCKYYVAWYLSEGACVLCGFGFNGYTKDGEIRWDRFTNIRLISCEFAQSIKEMIDNWNMGANRWLRYYVYMRVTPFGQTGGMKSTMITYGVSALWHGFYPGYYLFFLSITPFQMLARHIRKTYRPLTMKPGSQEPIPALKMLYDLGGIILSMGVINILSMAFNMLYWSPAITAWKQIYFIHYVGGVVVYVVWSMTGRSVTKYIKSRDAKASKEITPPSTPPLEKISLDNMKKN